MSFEILIVGVILTVTVVRRKSSRALKPSRKIKAGIRDDWQVPREETPMAEDMYVADRDTTSSRSRSASSGRGTSIPSSVNPLSGDEGTETEVSVITRAR